MAPSGGPTTSRSIPREPSSASNAPTKSNWKRTTVTDHRPQAPASELVASIERVSDDLLEKIDQFEERGIHFANGSNTR
jgi:hypothetical protein